jgi:MFS family permease
LTPRGEWLAVATLSAGLGLSALLVGAGINWRYIFLLSALSDWVGRTLVMRMGSLSAPTCLVLLAVSGPSPWVIFSCVFGVHFFNNALITLSVSPIATETVPASLMTTATGVVIAAGELLGGCLAPVIGGQIVQHFGIDHIPVQPIAMRLVGVIVSFALQETRPEKVSS